MCVRTLRNHTEKVLRAVRCHHIYHYETFSIQGCSQAEQAKVELTRAINGHPSALSGRPHRVDPYNLTTSSMHSALQAATLGKTICRKWVGAKIWYTS